MRIDAITIRIYEVIISSMVFFLLKNIISSARGHNTVFKGQAHKLKMRTQRPIYQKLCPI